MEPLYHFPGQPLESLPKDLEVLCPWQDNMDENQQKNWIVNWVKCIQMLVSFGLRIFDFDKAKLGEHAWNMRKHGRPTAGLPVESREPPTSEAKNAKLCDICEISWCKVSYKRRLHGIFLHIYSYCVIGGRF